MNICKNSRMKVNFLSKSSEIENFVPFLLVSHFPNMSGMYVMFVLHSPCSKFLYLSCLDHCVMLSVNGAKFRDIL